MMGGWEVGVVPRAVLSLKPGATFAVCHGDIEDTEPVTVIEVTPTHVLLKSRGDLNGWKPRELVEGAIAEANEQLSLRTQR